MVKKYVTRTLAAIVYADVAGYGRLTGQDKERTQRTLNAYLDVITTSIKEHGGRVPRYAGDAVLSEFASVIVTLTFAVEVQRDVASPDEGVPDDQKLQFRIGVNLDDMIVDHVGLYGDGVNIAARLESPAMPGGTRLSASVSEQFEGARAG